MPEDDEASLGDRLKTINTTLEKLRADLARDNEKRDKRIRLHRIAIACAFLVAGFGVLVGAWGIHEVRNANDERDTARLAACRQYNEQEQQGIDASTAQSHDALVQLTGLAVDIGVQLPPGFIDSYNERHDKLIRMGHPLRDCTPAGIDKYLNAERPGD